MNAYLTIDKNFSILFSAPEILTDSFIINLLNENAKFLNDLQLPKFELRFIKSFNNNDTKFGSGQLNVNYNGTGKKIIISLISFEQPKWWLKNWNRKYNKGINDFNEIIQLN